MRMYTNGALYSNVSVKFILQIFKKIRKPCIKILLSTLPFINITIQSSLLVGSCLKVRHAWLFTPLWNTSGSSSGRTFLHLNSRHMKTIRWDLPTISSTGHVNTSPSWRTRYWRDLESVCSSVCFKWRCAILFRWQWFMLWVLLTCMDCEPCVEPCCLRITIWSEINLWTLRRTGALHLSKISTWLVSVLWN